MSTQSSHMFACLLFLDEHFHSMCYELQGKLLPHHLADPGTVAERHADLGTEAEQYLRKVAARDRLPTPDPNLPMLLQGSSMVTALKFPWKSALKVSWSWQSSSWRRRSFLDSLCFWRALSCAFESPRNGPLARWPPLTGAPPEN